MSLKLYNHIDRLPTWNYYEVIKQKDLRYLIVTDDYTNIPEIEKADAMRMSDIWNELNFQFGEGSINMNVLRLKNKAWECFTDYLIDPETQQNYHNAFAEFKKEFDKQNDDVYLDINSFMSIYMESISSQVIDKIYSLKDVKFKKFSDLYEKIRGMLTFDELIFIRLYLIEHLRSEEFEFDLIDEKINIELTLGIKIDIFQDPISVYMKYRRKAKNMVNQEKTKKMRAEKGGKRR